MWFERFVIIVTSLHRDFLPSSWSYFRPTICDISTFFGSFGLFFTLFLLFVRFLPDGRDQRVKGVTAAADPHGDQRSHDEAHRAASRRSLDAEALREASRVGRGRQAAQGAPRAVARPIEAAGAVPEDDAEYVEPHESGAARPGRALDPSASWRARPSTRRTASRPCSGVMGWFTSPTDLYHACEALRDAGYKPLRRAHAVPRARAGEGDGARRPSLRCRGSCSAAARRASPAPSRSPGTRSPYDYPLIISGKLSFSYQAFIPIFFELTVLLAALDVLLRALRARAPAHVVPPHRSSTLRSTRRQRRRVLHQRRGERPEVRSTETTSAPRAPRRSEHQGGRVVKRWSIPLLVDPRAGCRGPASSDPPIHVFGDMDWQPKFQPEEGTRLFPDGRAMRPIVEARWPRDRSTRRGLPHRQGEGRRDVPGVRAHHRR